MENLGAFFDALDRAEADELVVAYDRPPCLVVGGKRRALVDEPTPPSVVQAAALEIISHDELAAITHRPRVIRFANGDADYVVELARGADGLSIAIRPVPVEVELDQAAGAETTSLPPRHGTLMSLRAISFRPKPDLQIVSTAPITAQAPAVGNKIDTLLRRMVAAQASDLHLSPQEHPAVRIDGETHFLRDAPSLGGAEIAALLAEIGVTTEAVYEVPALGRFRVNVFDDQRGVGAAIRHVPLEIRSPGELRLPDACSDLCQVARGLVLVAGPMGAGRSTTIASMIGVVNEERAAHVVVFERVLETPTTNKRSLVHRHEAKSFATALRDVRRRNPDVVVVEDLREPEAIALAIDLANAGALVIAGVDAVSAASAIDRLVDLSPPDRQAHVRGQLRHALVGVIAQTLCKKVGGGRVVACETIVSGNVVTTLEDSLSALVKDGIVDASEALRKSRDPAALSARIA